MSEPNFRDAVAILGDGNVISTVFEKELLYVHRPQTATCVTPDQKTLTISTSGHDGRQGHSGHDGRDGGGSGDHGSDGHHGTNAERNVVGISSDGDNLNISRVIPPVNNSSCRVETYSFPLSIQMRCSLFALGGRGGDGGDGGRGGQGVSGLRGKDATRTSPATDGSKFLFFECLYLF